MKAKSALWLTIMLIFFGSTFAHSDGHAALDYSSMRLFREELKRNDLPVRNTGIGMPDKTDEDNAMETKDTFAGFQKAIFGKTNVINLESCKSCDARSDYDSRTIYLQPSFIRDLKKKYGASASVLIKFVIAHELSHFVQEASVGVGKNPNLSLNGFPSLFSGQMSSYGDNAPFHLAHAEVDIYGLLVLREFVDDKPLVILSLFDQFIVEAKQNPDPDFKLAIRDFEVRKTIVTKALNDLWP